MYAASQALARKWPGLRAKDAHAAAPLTPLDCRAFEPLLIDDGIRVSYSAMVSIADALRGIESGFYTWSIVKLYYSVFYGLRALLAFGRHAIFYVGHRQFSIEIRPGQRPRSSRTASSHELVLNLFQQHFAGSILLSQQIDFDNPLSWLRAQREAANYTQAKFCEPSVPPVMVELRRYAHMRTAISAYINEDLYAFDPDHAIVAYPIAVIKEISRTRQLHGLFNDTDKLDLVALLRDASGPLASFNTIINT